MCAYHYNKVCNVCVCMYEGALAEQVDDEDAIIRHHASLCLGKLVSTMASPDDGSDPDPTSRMKEFFGPYLLGSDDNIVCALHCVYSMYECVIVCMEEVDNFRCPCITKPSALPPVY